MRWTVQSLSIKAAQVENTPLQHVPNRTKKALAGPCTCYTSGCQTDAELGMGINLGKDNFTKQFNWVTVLAIIILVAGIGYLIMRRRRG